MKLLLLFLITTLAGGVGKYAGIVAGSGMAPGTGILLQLLLGSVLLVAGVMVAERIRAIRPFQRRWTIIGGLLGVVMSTVVTLATLSSPVAPFLVPALIGMGAALASMIGKSAHERADLT